MIISILLIDKIKILSKAAWKKVGGREKMISEVCLWGGGWSECFIYTYETVVTHYNGFSKNLLILFNTKVFFSQKKLVLGSNINI